MDRNRFVNVSPPPSPIRAPNEFDNISSPTVPKIEPTKNVENDQKKIDIEPTDVEEDSLVQFIAAIQREGKKENSEGRYMNVEDTVDHLVKVVNSRRDKRFMGAPSMILDAACEELIPVLERNGIAFTTICSFDVRDKSRFH
ncbi:hypothetical protein PRIPAC_83613 [Pristionchus pacificus]|uniref:Uncharacterized protein n=1 Tax=Pristionchus pacificus TaxID=54126 RepID=A0A2A6BS58_PRIPA|nr:hypothetical protein PRIPAC_83613 [Pristionchus pacificus]|eukprot:PDM68769.1 hypothetical protein PRIPAC_47071 [Pristionchus pacificus]